jgi:hypothetical protein
MAWSGEHRAYVVETYLKNSESVITTQRSVRTHFRLGWNATVPNRKTILLWVANFRATGSALKKKLPGRPHSVRSPQNIQTVTQAIKQSPRRSAQKHAAAMGMSEWSVRIILHTVLKFHPYKMLVVQELNQCDWVNHSDSCQAILQNVPANDVVLSCDEANFHLSGCVNKQNFRYRAENNPRQLHKRPLHSQRVTVWCAVADFGVIGPYFFWGGWENSHSNFRSLCADVMQLPGAEIERAWKSSSVVPTEWCHHSHGERIHGRPTRNVSRAPNLTMRWHPVASMFTQSLCLWLLSLGVPEG